jgi:hypothetical protein
MEDETWMKKEKTLTRAREEGIGRGTHKASKKERMERK